MVAGWLRYSRQFRTWSAHAAPAQASRGPRAPGTAAKVIAHSDRLKHDMEPERAEQAADGGRSARRDAVHGQVGRRDCAHQAADHVYGQHGSRWPHCDPTQVLAKGPQIENSRKEADHACARNQDRWSPGRTSAQPEHACPANKQLFLG